MKTCLPERPRNARTGVSVKKNSRRATQWLSHSLIGCACLPCRPSPVCLLRLSACGREGVSCVVRHVPAAVRLFASQLARFSSLKKREKPSPQEAVGRYPRRLCVPDLFAETRDRCCARAKTACGRRSDDSAIPRFALFLLLSYNSTCRRGGRPSGQAYAVLTYSETCKC